PADLEPEIADRLAAGLVQDFVQVLAGRGEALRQQLQELRARAFAGRGIFPAERRDVFVRVRGYFAFGKRREVPRTHGHEMGHGRFLRLSCHAFGNLAPGRFAVALVRSRAHRDAAQLERCGGAGFRPRKRIAAASMLAPRECLIRDAASIGGWRNPTCSVPITACCWMTPAAASVTCRVRSRPSARRPGSRSCTTASSGTRSGVKCMVAKWTCRASLPASASMI